MKRVNFCLEMIEFYRDMLLNGDVLENSYFRARLAYWSVELRKCL